jgi:hypothetical protein
VRFDGMSFHPQGDTLVNHLAIEQKDGRITEQKFIYARAK